MTGFLEALSDFVTSPAMNLNDLRERGYMYCALQWFAAALLAKE